jgi:hypothetical protein
MNALVSLLGLILFTSTAGAVPFWGDKASRDAGTDPQRLKPGQFIWDAEAVRTGPVVLVVSLDEQLAYVYRNGIRVGVASVSTGRPGHTTPTGVFTILQKDKDHHSKKYDNAPMPYSERLTWDGVALHAGGLPGYPSSHGCIHLPSEFAELLFGITEMGMTVVVAQRDTAPTDVVHPIGTVPVDARTGAALEVPRLSADEAYRWQPEKSPTGPVSLLFSAADQRVLVFRDGVEIGRARVVIDDPGHAARHARVSGRGGRRDRPLDRRQRARARGDAEKRLDPGGAEARPRRAGVHGPRAAAHGPGASLVVTDLPVLEQETTGRALTVVTADAPTPG